MKQAKKEVVLLSLILVNKEYIKRIKFPTIYRIITEIKNKFNVIVTWFVIGFLLGIIIFLFLSVILSITENVQILSKQKKIHANTLSNIIYWRSIIAKHNDYRDAYFQLALLEYKIGKKEQAINYAKKTLELDPYFKPAVSFLEEVSK